jgi:site-specific DNA-methyltransferase (adenine-specific)
MDKLIAQNIKVDMILCDLPYGVTACKWDKIIPFDELWERYERITKPNAAIVLFSAQPFTTDLIMSNRKMFRYEIIWEKTIPRGFINAKKMPMKAHDNICIFYKKLPAYNPIMQPRKDAYKKIGATQNKGTNFSELYNNDSKFIHKYVETGERYPTDVVHFSNWNGKGCFKSKTKEATNHPTQKPVNLCEYLIKTYTDEHDLVLDNCMGSGTTGVACENLSRDFIGIELDEHYFNIAQNRIEACKVLS